MDRKNQSLPLLILVHDGAFVIDQDAFCGTVEILVLARAHAPEEGGQSGYAEAKRNWYEPEQGRHLRISLIALAVTRSELADMAIAATSGVTKPNTASGTAMQL